MNTIDNESINIADALVVSKEYYNDKTYAHALRVMQYVAENEMIPKEYRNDCLCLALMHDLLEDTDFKAVYLPENFTKALKLLTKPKDMDYIEYIKDIRNTGHTNWRMCAYYVKLADMKDHFMQTETLTDKLKEKYLNAIGYLL